MMMKNLFRRHLPLVKNNLSANIRTFSTKEFNYQLLQLDEMREGLRESAEKFSA